MNRILIIALALLALLTCACHKDQNSDSTYSWNPATGNGTLTGTLNTELPLAVSITTTQEVNGRLVHYSADISKTGQFEFTRLPPGNYTLQLSVNDPLYLGADIPAAKVTAGKTTELGSITLKRNPDLASLSGAVYPAAAASEARAMLGNPYRPYISAPVDPQTGKFTIPGIPAGTRGITFLTADRFTPPPALPTFLLKTGQQTDAGIINFTSYGRIATLSFKLNGTATSGWTGTSTYLDQVLSLTATRITSPLFNWSPRQETLSIILHNVTGPGTYLCVAGSPSRFFYNLRPVDGGNAGTTWSSDLSNATATITITEIDAALSSISGTFTATLTNYTGNIQEISSGAFITGYK